MPPKKSVLEHILTGLVIGDGCWEWRGRKGRDGYGRMSFMVDDIRVFKLAHRVVYEMVVGEIPTGLQIDHLCRNKCCVRPDHLEPVTQAENMRRMGPFQRLTTCSKGHALVEGNREPTKNGLVRCRTCRRERRTKLYARLKAQGRCSCGNVPDAGYKCCLRCRRRTPRSERYMA